MQPHILETATERMLDDARSTRAVDRAACLIFARKYPGWHTFNRDPRTRLAIAGLAARGLIQCNYYGQFRAVHADGSAFE